MEKRISGHTGLLALIGSPVGHSGSPAMYNYSFEKLGLDYAYVAFDIKEDKVKDAIAAMKTFNMRGCNVTIVLLELSLREGLRQLPQLLRSRHKMHEYVACDAVVYH